MMGSCCFTLWTAALVVLVAVVLLGPVVVDANNTVSGGVKATVAAVSAAPPAAVQWGALAAEQCTFATSPNGILFIHFHIPKSGGSTIERLPLRYCRLPYGEKCLFWPQDGHWVFKNVLTQIERGKEVFKEKYGAPPDCVQIVTELRDPLYRTRSAFYAARARRAFFGNETKAQCPHIECHDDNALAMIENYNVTFEEALEGGMNYFRNMLSFYTGVNTQEGAKALYGSMSFVFRTTHLSHDVQIFGYKYGFNANIMSKFVTDFLDHSKTCSGLWKEPPTEERSATTIRNQNMLDEDIYQGGMEVWAPRWKHLNDVYAKKLKREHYECSKEIAGEECGSRGRNTCLLVKSLSKNKNNVR